MKILKLFALFSLAIMLSSVAFGQKKEKGKKGKEKKLELKTETDSVSYCLGVTLGKGLKDEAKMAQFNSAIFSKAVDQIFEGDSTAFTPQQASQVIQAYFMKLQNARNEKNLKDGKAFLEQNKTKEGVVTLPSGLQYQILKAGNGPKPQKTDTVRVDYKGTLTDGRVFDSSIDRGQPIEFPCDRVIPGWTEALQLMPVGSKWKLFVPTELAYGENVQPGSIIEPNMVLVFEVELLGIVHHNQKAADDSTKVNESNTETNK